MRARVQLSSFRFSVYALAHKPVQMRSQSPWSQTPLRDEMGWYGSHQGDGLRMTATIHQEQRSLCLFALSVCVLGGGGGGGGGGREGGSEKVNRMVTELKQAWQECTIYRFYKKALCRYWVHDVCRFQHLIVIKIIYIQCLGTKLAVLPTGLLR